MKNKIKIFSDGADLKSFRDLSKESYIKGFTTNPTLMRKAGVKDYERFASKVLEIIGNKPISFEVFADSLPEMERQAKIIQAWGANVYVKIPIVNSKGLFTLKIIKNLSDKGIRLNITAVMTINQLILIKQFLNKKSDAIVSVFSGRIADTGRDPSKTIISAKNIFRQNKKTKILWASTREILNIYQAEKAGSDIITVPPNLLEKYKNLKHYSLEKLSQNTSKMFWDDAKKSVFKI